MSKDDAIKLALGALVYFHLYAEGEKEEALAEEAITALREAQAEQPAPVQQDACPTCGEYEPRTGTCGTSPNDKRALCNRNAPQPAQPEPETKDVVIANMGDPFTVKAYVIPQPAQQEYWEEQPDGTMIPVDPSEMQPAQRTWVGLTDEDIRPMCKQAWVFDTVKQWAEIIEAKLKEKNT